MESHAISSQKVLHLEVRIQSSILTHLEVPEEVEGRTPFCCQPAERARRRRQPPVPLPPPPPPLPTRTTRSSLRNVGGGCHWKGSAGDNCRSRAGSSLHSDHHCKNRETLYFSIIELAKYRVIFVSCPKI